MEFLRSLLRGCFARAQVATSQNVSCFLRLNLALPLLLFGHKAKVPAIIFLSFVNLNTLLIQTTFSGTVVVILAAIHYF